MARLRAYAIAQLTSLGAGKPSWAFGDGNAAFGDRQPKPLRLDWVYYETPLVGSFDL